jgi:hypothetical protein
VSQIVKVASVTWNKLKLAEDKMVDLNAFTIRSAMSMIAGTARSMGITVSGDAPFFKERHGKIDKAKERLLQKLTKEQIILFERCCSINQSYSFCKI